MLSLNYTPTNYTPIFHFSSKIPQTHLFFPSNTATHVKKSHLLLKKRSWSSHFALKSEENDEFLVDDDIDDDDVDEEDDDEVIVPLKNMKKWLENKPMGFGVGKVYDTSIEDKLMEEIEQSRKAQVANINKLKNDNNSSVKAGSVEKQVDKDVQGGCRVRLVNLPKKMNIDKDLRAAFKGVPGIVNIVPVVTGNKKTRDPVCKGLAFIDFKSEDKAQRFVQMFSGRSIPFGKVEKQIKCEMMNPKAPKSTIILSVDEKKDADELEISDQQNDELHDDFDAGFLSSDSDENMSADDFVAELEDSSASMNDYMENSEISSAESTSGDEQDAREESYSSEQENKVQAKKEKKKLKQKKEKVPKLNIPGAARKLKIKEKAVLTGVLSKYAQKSTISAVKEQS